MIDRDRDLIRLMLREFDTFPELFEPMWQGVLTNLYEQVGAWIDTQGELGAIAVADPEATTNVLLASLTYYPLLESLIGHPPGDIERERFRAAWIEHAASTLGLRR